MPLIEHTRHKSILWLPDDGYFSYGPIGHDLPSFVNVHILHVHLVSKPPSVNTLIAALITLLQEVGNVANSCAAGFWYRT